MQYLFLEFPEIPRKKSAVRVNYREKSNVTAAHIRLNGISKIVNVFTSF